MIEKKELMDFYQKSILRVFNPLEGEISLHWRAMGKGRTRISSSSRPPHSFLPSLARKFTFTSRGLRVSVFPRKFPRGRYDGCINNTGVSEFLRFTRRLISNFVYSEWLRTFFLLFSCSLFRPSRKYPIEQGFYSSIEILSRRGSKGFCSRIFIHADLHAVM